MNGYMLLLSNILPSSMNLVTFGSITKGSVLGSGSLNVPGLPKLRDLYLVDRLKANLISISQLCDKIYSRDSPRTNVLS